MEIVLIPGSDQPLFMQIHDQIVHAISTGQAGGGYRLASVRELAAEFGINPATVQKAYELLRAEGVISSTSRSGSVVRDHTQIAPDHLKTVEQRLRADLSLARAQGATPAQLRALTARLIKEFT